MAILRNGPNGGFSGKVGSIIGYRLNGQDIIKGFPKKRRTKPSKKEQVNRAKFAMMQAWLQPLLHFLRIGFKNYAPTFQGFVAAKSYNSRHAFKQDENDAWFIDPAQVLVSYGNLPLPQDIQMEVIDGEIVITWNQKSSKGGALDSVMVIVYAPKTSWIDGDFAASKRYTGKAVIQLPDHTAGNEVHAYLAFVAYDQSAQSNSYYLGTINLGQ